MSKNKYYKVICDEINLVLLIRKLSAKQEQDNYDAIKKKINGLKASLSIESYMAHIIKSFLHNSDQFFNNLPEEEEEHLAILKAVYQSIIEAYPPFDLNFICADINNGTFLEDLQKVLGTFSPEGAFEEASNLKNSIKSINNLNDIQGLDKFLKRKLIGQDQAISSVVESIKLIASGLYDNASFFFIGPTGVGKTELARLLGKRYSSNFWKINCAEYSASHEYSKLIGSPPGYVGHSEKSLMAEKAQQSNRWVILFDEIEKAHSKFYDFLLSLLDDGTCTDNMGRVLDFSESIFIFTSNQGISDVKVGKKLGFSSDYVSVSSSKEEVTASVKDNFPVEFMNRIDNYIFFNTLSQDDLRKIATLSLSNVPIKRHKALLDYVVKNGYSEEYGARNIKRFIKNKVAPVVAQSLLERRLPKKKGDLYTPKIKDNKLFLTNLESPTDQAAG